MAVNGSLFFAKKNIIGSWLSGYPDYSSKDAQKSRRFLLLASGAKSLSKSALTIVFWGATTNPRMDFFTTKQPKHLTIPDLSDLSSGLVCPLAQVGPTWLGRRFSMGF